MNAQTATQPTAPVLAPDTLVIIEKTDTVESSQTFTLEELEDYADTTLAEAGSLDELVEQAKDHDGFYDYVNKHAETSASDWTIRVGGEAPAEDATPADDPEPAAPYVTWLNSTQYAEADTLLRIMQTGGNEEAAHDAYNAVKAGYLDHAEREIARLTQLLADRRS